MKKPKKLIVGNWKMNPIDLAEAKKIVSSVKKVATSVKRTEIVICPPYIYLHPLSSLIKSPVYIGAQNVHEETLGAYTGEVSYAQVSQFNVDYVIVGHSDRRKMGEDDAVINKKVRAVVSSHMKAIVCVGESLRDSSGDYFSVIRDQISSALKDVSKKHIDQIVIAYEPIWAIGAREAMSGRDLHEMSIYIRKVLKDLYGILGDNIPILYGGSVDKNNAAELVKEGNVSGLLIGRQSIMSKDFVEIIRSVDAL